MIIDGHIHLGGCFNKFENIIASMDKAGIAKSIVVPNVFNGDNLFKHYLLPNWVVSNNFMQKMTPKLLKLNRVRKRYVLQPQNNLTKLLIQQYPKRFLGFFWINPNISKDIEELEQQIINGPFTGIKLHQVIHPFKINSYAVEKILDVTDKYRIPLFIHIDSKEDYDRVISQAKNRPKTLFILAHMDYYSYWLEGKHTKLDNIYYDVSPITTPKLIKIKEVIKKIGSQKLLFGTDTPYPGGQENAVKTILKLRLPLKDYDNLFANNYLQIFSRVENKTYLH